MWHRHSCERWMSNVAQALLACGTVEDCKSVLKRSYIIEDRREAIARAGQHKGGISLRGSTPPKRFGAEPTIGRDIWARPGSRSRQHQGRSTASYIEAAKAVWERSDINYGFPNSPTKLQLKKSLRAFAEREILPQRNEVDEPTTSA